MNQNIRAKKVLKDAGVGLAATVAMSVVFAVADRAKIIDKTPPQLIVDCFLPALPPRAAHMLALAAHVGYGVAGGTLYGALSGTATTSSRARSAAEGAAFGVMVWAVSYEGWVPFAGVIPPARSDDRGRAFVILSAQIVYGTVLGLSMNAGLSSASLPRRIRGFRRIFKRRR